MMATAMPMPISASASHGLVDDDLSNLDELEVGKTFSNFEELKSYLKSLEKERNIIISVIDSETIAKASRRVKWVREEGRPELYYKYVIYGCYKSSERKSRSCGKRKRQSVKQNCPWKLAVMLQDKGDKKGKELVVKEAINEHNHEIVQAVIDSHPKRRRLDKQSQEMAIQALQLNVDRKVLQQKLKRETGKLVLLKDLTNLEQKMKVKAPKDIQGLIEHLKRNKPHLKVYAAYDDEQEGAIQGIFVMDHEMEIIYKAYPEILLMDATYKSTDDRMAIYILLAIDGNGESHVISFFLAHNETHNLLSQMVEAFKSNFHSSITSRTRIIITDKGFTEPSILSSVFPHAELQHCLFFTLRSFSRDVTSVKMSFRHEERNIVLALLQRLAYSKTSTEYDQRMRDLEVANFPLVVDYIKRNWHCIQGDWVAGLKAESLTLSQQTTNHLESLNKHIKSNVYKMSNLTAFFDQFFLFLDSCCDERNSRVCRMSVTTISQMDEQERKFRSHLTDYAWEQIKQFVCVRKAQVASLPNGGFCVDGHSDVQVGSCGCHFTTSYGLPCLHILAARDHLGLEIFDEALILPRWSRKYVMENHRKFHENSASERDGYDSRPEINFNPTHAQKKDDSDDFSRKESEAKVHCDKLASALARLPQQVFEWQLEQVKLLVESVEGHTLADNHSTPSQSTNTDGFRNGLQSALSARHTATSLSAENGPRKCCICGNLSGKSFDFPSVITHQGPVAEELTTQQLTQWMLAARLSKYSHDSAECVCSRHFVSGQPAVSLDCENIDWVPTLFLNENLLEVTKTSSRKKPIPKRNIRNKKPSPAPIATTTQNKAWFDNEVDAASEFDQSNDKQYQYDGYMLPAATAKNKQNYSSFEKAETQIKKQRFQDDVESDKRFQLEEKSDIHRSQRQCQQTSVSTESEVVRGKVKTNSMASCQDDHDFTVDGGENDVTARVKKEANFSDDDVT